MTPIGLASPVRYRRARGFDRRQSDPNGAPHHKWPVFAPRPAMSKCRVAAAARTGQLCQEPLSVPTGIFLGRPQGRMVVFLGTDGRPAMLMSSLVRENTL